MDEHDRMIGTLEPHEVRAAITADRNLNSPVGEIMNKAPLKAYETSDLGKLVELSNGYIPVLDKDDRVLHLHAAPHYWKKRKGSKTRKIQDLIVGPDRSLKKVMHILDITEMNIVLVVDENQKFLGLVTERDVRDAILNGHDSETPVSKIMNTNPVTGVQGLSKRELARLLDSKIALGRLKVTESRPNIKIPILNEKNQLQDLAIFDELEPEKTLFFVGDDETLYKNRVKTVLITGGAGYIGSILCRKLLKKGYKVRVLDNLIYGDSPIKELYDNADFELIRGDIRHIEDVVRAIHGMDAVIHLAAIVGDPACSLGPRLTIESNYLATKLLADICKHHQVNRFVFSSTCSVYGASSQRLTETSELNPVSLYARSKIYSEKAVLEIIDENFSPTILRLGTVYGLSPRPRFDLVLNVFVARAITEGAIQIEGGKQYRPMVHVSDVADAFVACLEAPLEKVRGETFNVGSNAQNLHILDLGKKVIALIPNAKLEHSQTKSDTRDYWVYFDKIKNTLSFEPQFTIEEGVRELIRFFEANGGLDYKNSKFYNHQSLTNILEPEYQSSGSGPSA